MKRISQYAIIIISILFLILLFVVKSAIGEAVPVSWDKVIFTIFVGEESFDIRLWHNYVNDENYLFLPSFLSGRIEKENIKVSISGTQRKKWDDNVTLKSASTELIDLSPGSHRLVVGRTDFPLTVMCSAKVPAMFLDTKSGSLSFIEKEKGNSESAIYKMLDSEGKTLGSGAVNKIRSRGNATFLEDKKPYQINLAEPTDLTGFGAKDKYILLANRQDQSLIRNSLMYDLADDLSLPYSPKSVYIDLYINEDYRGSYQLCEKVDTGTYGVPIETESGDRRTDYMVSLEYNYQDRIEAEDYIFFTEAGQPVSIKRPKAPTEAQLSYISNDFDKLQKSILSGNIDRDRLDLESFAKKYLLEEIGKNLDAMHASQYFYSDKGMIYAGPIWDHDKTLGNPLIEKNRAVDFHDPTGVFAATVDNGASWWYDLYQIEEFREAAISYYRDELRRALDYTVENRIDIYKKLLWQSAGMDYIRWDTLEDMKYGLEPDFERGYNEQLDIIREFIIGRKAFFDELWLGN